MIAPAVLAGAPAVMRGRNLLEEGFLGVSAIMSDCLTGPACLNAGRCRCAKVTGIRVFSFEVPELSGLYPPTRAIGAYARERALTALTPWRDLQFEAEPTEWGEDLIRVFLPEGPAAILDGAVAELDSLADDRARVLRALELEYGSVLAGLEQAEFAIEEVARERLRLGAAGHAASRTEEDLAPYRGHRGVLGLVVPAGRDRLRVIDGYHRILATDHDPVRVLVGRWPEGAGAPPRAGGDLRSSLGRRRAG